MPKYIAKIDENNAIVLSRNEQLDEMLKKGHSIYYIDDELNETIIASPDKGYIVEKPSLEQVSQSSTSEIESLRSDVDFITMMTGVDLGGD